MRIFIKIGSALLGAMFLLAVVVQFNDPDPIPWMLVYGGAVAACAMATTVQSQKWLRTVAGVIGAVALVWALFLLPRVLGQVEPGSLFRETGMATLEIEEAREALGLLLVAFWMLVLFIGARVLRTDSGPATGRGQSPH